jgi:D-aminopeptidase
VLGQEAFPLAPHAPALTEQFAPLVGTVYASPSGDTVAGFGDAGGKLGLMLHNLPPIPLRTEAGALVLDFNRSATGPYRIALAPLAPDATAPSQLEFDDGRALQSLERLPEAPPLAQAGQALVGRYRAADLAADAVVAFEGEALRLRIAGEFGPSVLDLKPYSSTLFAWTFVGELAPLGGTLTIEHDGLRLNTLRTRHMHLQRIED